MITINIAGKMNNTRYQSNLQLGTEYPCSLTSLLAVFSSQIRPITKRISLLYTTQNSANTLQQ